MIHIRVLGEPGNEASMTPGRLSPGHFHTENVANFCAHRMSAGRTLCSCNSRQYYVTSGIIASSSWTHIKTLIAS